MSLLMDALRKAEQEKKAAAKRLREQQLQDTGAKKDSGNDLSLQIDKPADTERTEISDRQGKASFDPEQLDSEADTLAREWQRPAAELELTSLELSQPRSAGDGSKNREPMQSAGEYEDHVHLDADSGSQQSNVDIDLSMAAEEQQSAFAASDKTLAYDPTGDRTHSDKETNRSDASAKTDKDPGPGAENTLADNSAAEATLSDTVDRSGSSRSTRASADGQQSDSISIERIDTPARAQQVFAARKSASPATLTILVLVALIVVGLTASGVFYYYSVTPSVREVASSHIAQDIELRQGALEKIELPKSESETGPSAEPAVIQPQSSVETLSDDRGSDAGSMVAEADSELAEKTDIEGAISQSQAEASPDPAVTEKSDERIAASNENQADTAEDRTAALDELELKPALLKISRSQPDTDINKVVQDAYAAYSRGELSLAKELYLAALRDNPEDRNVLLGLAAIAVQEQRFDAAYRYYADILRQNPSDRVAGTAIISMQQQGDPAARESRIKRMIEETPGAAYLHQALGQVYAQTKRWPQAQQAYFDAYRLDKQNADYAYNLAVSLDHMGQPQAARDYYIKALELAASRPGSFARDSAQDRISQISQSSTIR